MLFNNSIDLLCSNQFTFLLFTSELSKNINGFVHHLMESSSFNG